MHDFSDFIERAVTGRTTIAGVKKEDVAAVVKATVEAIESAVGCDTTIEQLADGAECANCRIWFAMSALHQIGGGGNRDDAPEDDEDDDDLPPSDEFTGDYLCSDCQA